MSESELFENDQTNAWTSEKQNRGPCRVPLFSDWKELRSNASRPDVPFCDTRVTKQGAICLRNG